MYYEVYNTYRSKIFDNITIMNGMERREINVYCIKVLILEVVKYLKIHGNTLKLYIVNKAFTYTFKYQQKAIANKLIAEKKQNSKSYVIQQKAEYKEIMNREQMQPFENTQHEGTLKSSKNQPRREMLKFSQNYELQETASPRGSKIKN